MNHVPSERIRELQDKINAKRYDFVDFLRVSEYEYSELISKNRKANLVLHRQVCAVWMVLSGKGVVETGITLNVDHSTISHSLKKVKDYLDNGYYEKFNELISRLKQESNFAIIGSSPDQVKSSMQMEELLYSKFPWIFVPSEFKCMNLSIGNQLGISSKRCVNQCSACK